VTGFQVVSTSPLKEKRRGPHRYRCAVNYAFNYIMQKGILYNDVF